MQRTLEAIAFRRLRLLSVHRSKPILHSPAVLAPVVAELAALGVRAQNPEMLNNSIVSGWFNTIEMIRDARGGGRPTAPLFDGFPDKLPAFDDAELRFLFGAARLFMSVRVATDGTLIVTEDDVRTAMDFSQIGWWPASSVPQNVEADALAKQAQTFLRGDDRVEWIDVTVVDAATLPERLKEWVALTVAAPASMREDIRLDVEFLLEELGHDFLDLATITFGETLALISARFWRANDYGAIIESTPSPDQLLRIFATLTGSDVSLHQKITWPRFTKRQRRVVLQCLGRTPRARDVWRRRGLWLGVARSLHPVNNASAFPQAYSLFDELYHYRYDRLSTRSRAEWFITEGQPVRAAQLLAMEAPGVLLRQVRRLSSQVEQTSGDARDLFNAVGDAAEKAPLRVLLAAREQIMDNGATYPRLAITKRGAFMSIDRAVGHQAVSDDLKWSLVALLAFKINKQIAERDLPPSWGSPSPSVWIDPALNDIPIPDQMRSGSGATAVLDRGAKVRLPDDMKVIRLFVHWRQPEGQYSDLDLSCIALDAEFNHLGQVSWTNLANNEMTHSGDLTSAPNGASEFIDVRLDSVRAKKGYRYIAPSIFRYSGPAFNQLPEAKVGWMLRDQCSSDRKTFDIATVADVFTLTGAGGTAIPFLYDIQDHAIIWMDGYFHSRWGARTETSTELQLYGRSLTERRLLRPSVATLASFHAVARMATNVQEREKAGITFGLDDDCTYNALRPEKLLAELL